MQRTLRHAIAVLAGVLLCAGALLGAEQGNFDRTLTVTGPVDLTVTTGSGRVTVKPGGAGSVIVHATVRVGDSWGGGDAQARLQRILQNPPIEQNGNIIRIGRIDDPELTRNVSISYDITTPAETRLSSKTGSGDIVAEGLRGPAEVSSGSGTLRLDNIGDHVRANTGSGDIHVSNTKGEARISTGSGRIEATGIGGAFDGSTGSGDIVMDQSSPGSVNVGTGSGTITLRNVKGALKVSTGSGDVRAQGEMTGDWRVETGSGRVQMELPQQASFDLYARSSSGRITVDHEVTMQGTLNRHEVRGKIKGGGYMVDLRTGSGDIVVR
jgi:hypothetical protein